MGVAFVFSGANTYRVGMARDLYHFHAKIRTRFREANEVLGYDLASVMFHGPAEVLNRISVSQPAIVAYGVSVMDVFTDAGIEAVSLAGHSLGEFAALIGAGVISFCDAIQLVAARAKLIEDLAPRGSGSMMAVEGASEASVSGWCERAQPLGYVRLANLNAPAQFVVSGHYAALEEMKRLVSKESKCRCIALNVDYPFHSELLKAVEAPLNRLLENVDFRDARSPVISNHTGTPVWIGSEWKRLIARQLCGAVHWEKSVRRIVRLGATTFVEMGPGRVLRGLIRRISPSVEVMTTDNVNTVEYGLNRLASAQVLAHSTGALEAACAI